MIEYEYDPLRYGCDKCRKLFSDQSEKDWNEDDDKSND